jgi:hypothetical protein
MFPMLQPPNQVVMKPPLVLIHTKKGGEGEEGVIRQTCSSILNRYIYIIGTELMQLQNAILWVLLFIFDLD